MGKTWTVINTIKNKTMTCENNENNGHKDWKQFGGRKCAGALEKSGRRRFGGKVGGGEGRSEWRRGRRLRERGRRLAAVWWNVEISVESGPNCGVSGGGGGSGKGSPYNHPPSR